MYKIQTQKRFKRTLFIRTEHNLQTFGIIPLIKLHNDTETTVKRWKNDEKWDGNLNNLSGFGSALLFSCALLAIRCYYMLLDVIRCMSNVSDMTRREICSLTNKQTTTTTAATAATTTTTTKFKHSLSMNSCKFFFFFFFGLIDWWSLI